MCAQCAIVAAAAASGARSWLHAQSFTWLTPGRLKAATIALIVAAFVASSVVFTGSSRHSQQPAPDKAAQTR
jgi:hypothetical protein